MALAAATIWLAVLALPDNNLHLVVCDVGQGDAILITYKTTQMLVDGGPNSSVLKCLGDHMPFYDHRIEAVVLTHPQADHLNGLIDVVKRYTVLQFVKLPIGNDTSGYRELMKLIARLNTIAVYSGDEIKLGEIKFSVVWPTKEFVAIYTSPPAPLLNSGEGGPGRVGEVDLNDTAIVGVLEYGKFTAMLTGDAGADVVLPVQADVLKVPHHGSKYGMTREWLEAVRPSLAVISVGKRNPYGHPAPEALKLLRDEEKSISSIKILRTDEDGTVEVVSDGRSYWVK